MTRNKVLATTLLTLLLAFLSGPSFARLSAEEAEAFYRQGQDALADGRYDDAVRQFRALSQQQGAQVDRAIYWQAYAEARAEKKKDALATLGRLSAEHPDSPWLDDAQALKIELGGVAATRAAKSAGDDDLKLYALDALMQAEPERAVSLIDDFLRGDHSTQLKRRALFVLSQTETPRASEILSRQARDGSDPELQGEAIQALGYSDEPSAVRELLEIYRAGGSPDIKRRIIHSLVASDAVDVMADLVRTETEPETRREAIRALGMMDATADLETLARELGPEYRVDFFRAYGIAGDSAPLLMVVRQSRDPQEIADAIDGLVVAGSDEATRRTLVDLYGSTGERAVQQKILEFLMVEDEAEPLIEIFRNEDDPELKREALRHLSRMDDPAVQSLVEELLKG